VLFKVGQQAGLSGAEGHIDRQGEEEAAALARLAFHPHGAAVQLDDALGDGEAEAGGAGGAGGFAGLGKFLKDVWQQIGGNARTGILNLDQQIVLHGAVVGAQHNAAGFGEAGGI